MRFFNPVVMDWMRQRPLGDSSAVRQTVGSKISVAPSRIVH